MRVFTDGERVLLRTAAGLLSWAPKTPVELAPPEVPEISDDRRDGLLVIDPSGQDHSGALAEAGAVDAAAVAGGQVAALLDRGGCTVLAVGAPDGDWQSEIELSEVEGPWIRWPDGLLWDDPGEAGSLLEAAEAQGGGIPADPDGLPTLGANRYGYAVASRLTGLVTVVRAGQAAPDLTVRLPAPAEATIHAEPTKRGVLATLRLAGGQTAAVHVGKGGTVLGAQGVHSSPPALLLAGDRIVLYDDREGILRLLDAQLDRAVRKKIAFRPRECAAAADGRSFALASDAILALGKLTAKGRLSLVESVDYVAALKAAKRSQAGAAQIFYDPKRGHGSPVVGFPTNRKPPAWTGVAGQPCTLELWLRSTGGKGRGVYVELAGDALQHVDFTHVTAGDIRQPLQPGEGGLRAELKDVELVVGVRYPLDPAPKNDRQKELAQELLAKTHFTLEVHGHAKGASRDLLKVSVGALGSQSSPMSWMRPLVIAEQPE